MPRIWLTSLLILPWMIPVSYTHLCMDDRVIGTVYTNKAYAMYVEMGTGPKGAANHAGISPVASPAYTMSPWWIHESQVDKEAAEEYHWFYLDTPDGRFYQCTGQSAQPFMLSLIHI